MAEHLMNYIKTPTFMVESLYDAWQLQNILQIPCMAAKADINECSVEELDEIHKYADRTSALLTAAFNVQPTVNAAWSPACPFHCLSHLGLVTDPASTNFTVPALSQNTLGYTVN